MPPSSGPSRPDRAGPPIPDAEIVPDPIVQTGPVRTAPAGEAASGIGPAAATGAFDPGPAMPSGAYGTGTPGRAPEAGGVGGPGMAPRFTGPAETAAAARSGRLGATLGGLALLGVVLEAGALAYGWTHPQVPEAVAQDAARMQALDGQVQAAKQQRDGLAGALDTVQTRLAAVEGRPAPNLAPIEQRLATLEKPGPIASTDVSELARRLDSIAGRQDQLAARQQADVATLSGRTDAAAAQATAAASAAVAALGKQLDSTQAAFGRQLDTVQATVGKQLDAAQAGDKAARDALSGRIDTGLAADKQARDQLAASLSGRIDAATAQAGTAAAQAGAAGIAATAALGGRIDAAQAADKAALDSLAGSLGKRIDDSDTQDKSARDTLAASLGKRIDGSDAQDKSARDALAASLGKRMDDADAQDKSALDALSGKVDALDGRLVTVEQSSGKVAGLAARAGGMARLQSAQDNLAAGHKLGPIPDAPPALARYADTPPPTEAALRLSFANAAEAARLASQPQNARQPFLGRVWARVQQTVVVRQGDDVIVGDPAAGVLARAGDAMNAGDLPGTVEIVETLQGPAKEAMAPWLAQAHQLLDARAALASLVAHS